MQLFVFAPGNLASFCTTIVNSVLVVGLYYGFLTTFSIGPSYLFLLRAHLLEEETEKKVSATTGFFTGQLMMFISIYYAPLHRALGRPHTITAIVLPYFLLYFLFNTHERFTHENYMRLGRFFGSTFRNKIRKKKSMRKFSVQYTFLNNFIFQLFNHFILPSSIVARLVNIYMFRCNNKMLFVTSSFVGCLLGHILFWKWLGLLLVWIRSIRSQKIQKNRYFILYIKYNNFFVSEWRDAIFQTLLVFLFLYSGGRMPTSFLTMKFEGSPKMGIAPEKEEEDVEKDQDEEELDQGEEVKKLDQKEEEEEEFQVEVNAELFKELGTLFFDPNRFVTLLFDPNRWNRPFRYIKNERFDNAFRTEMSQYFFDTCPRAGKERICFTYPPTLSTFWEMINENITLDQLSTELSNYWIYTNEQKSNNLRNEFVNRIEALDKESVSLNRLQTRSRLCNDNTKNEYFPPIFDPLLNGPDRKTMREGDLEKEKEKPLVDEHEKETTLVETSLVLPQIHDSALLRENFLDFFFARQIKGPLSRIKTIHKKMPRLWIRHMEDWKEGTELNNRIKKAAEAEVWETWKRGIPERKPQLFEGVEVWKLLG